jgi:3-mercaptopyruvate sulfurtransferase SseA
MRAGVGDVRLLDGGWPAWIASRHTVEIQTNPRVAVKDFGLKIPAHPEYILDISQVKDLLKEPNARLVSIRRWEEFIGKNSGYNYIEPKGSVPGSVWGHDNKELRDQDGRMASFHRIAALWNEWDIRPDKKVVFYCGTGWRASEAWFYAYLMGWKDIAVYDGGWMDWSKDPANHIQTGDPRQTDPIGQKRP